MNRIMKLAGATMAAIGAAGKRAVSRLTTLGALAVLGAATGASAQTILVNQVPVNGGGISRWSQLWQDPGPNGNDLDGDSVLWQDFVLSAPATIDHMEWWGTGACELGFRIEFWRQDPGTIAYQPIGVFYYGGDHTVQPTRRINTTSFTATPDAGVTHYSLDIASPVSLAANDASNPRWFVAVIGLTAQAYQTWNWAQGTGGSNRSYQFVRGLPFRSLNEGHALLLRGAGGTTVTIGASVAPAGAGAIQGAGAYPVGAGATLVATPNTGWAFVNWTEGAGVVSTSSTYSFLVSVDRTLVANFTQAYTISTAAQPAYGGTTGGGGVFIGGASVTVTATPNAGYVFTDWTEFGGSVSTSPEYTFAAGANRSLVANFMPDPNSVLFDFDTAPVHTSLPVDLTVNGLTAHLGATGSGFSIQPANTMGFTPQGFGGLCIYPNSVFAADLNIAFSEPLTYFSIMFSPQELGCDSSARMRVTAFMNGTQVGTATATAPAPGTWPTGMLSIGSATPFNSVVVRYDARPPTCQDWGPIFLADNMTVTRACAPVSVSQQPVSTWSCPTGAAMFSTVASGSGTIGWQWERETSPGSGVYTPLNDGPTGFGATLSGTWSASLVVSGPGLGDAANYRCAMTNACGTATSLPATLVVYAGCPCSAADIAASGNPDPYAGPDGFVTGEDFDVYIVAFFKQMTRPVTGELIADITDGTGTGGPDGFVTGTDFDRFVQVYFTGC